MIETEGPTDILKFFPKDTLEKIEALLEDPLSDEIIPLCQQINVLSGWQGRLRYILADANSLLCFAEQQALMARDSKMTDFDRKVYLVASVRNERRLRDIIKGFSQSLRSKLIAAMSLKKTLMGEIPWGQEG